jgi:CheY-like chemotaxis protein
VRPAVQFPDKEPGTDTFGKSLFQRDAPWCMARIPKPGKSCVVKVETDLEPANRNLNRAKGLKVMLRRALVVENEPAMCALIHEVLQSAEMEVVTPVKSGENERHFHEEKFDVVLIGLCTPSVDGIELVRKIRKSGFNRLTPIIMISDDQRPSALTEGFDAGASFFVYKPIDRAHLTRLILVTQGTIEHERRRFRRVPLRVKILIKSDKTELVGETIDVSLNGALVRSPQTLPLGSLIEVSLYLLAGTKPVVGLGSVVRVLSSTQMGILLDRFPVSEIGRLQEFLLPRITD